MVFLNVKIDPFRRIGIEDVNGESAVDSLRNIASELTNLAVKDIELVYCGNILKDGMILNTISGFSSDMTVHVLKKVHKPAKKPCSMTESDLPHLVMAFKNAARAVNYRAALQRLSRPAVLESIIAATPALADDPVALALIQDPELITQLVDGGVAKRVLQSHPALAEACQYIVTVLHEEAAKTPTTSSNPSSGYFFSLESLSDDDEEEPSQQRPGTSASITSAQVAAALASIRSLTTPAATTTPTSSSTSAITNEMLGRALGRAMATSANIADPSPAASTNVPTESQEQRDLQSSSRRLGQYLQQMNELGLRDQTINLQALQASDWNVQEAINLILSGALSDLNDASGE